MVSDKRGYSLLEVVTVLSIAAIIGALSIGGLEDSAPRHDTRQATLQFTQAVSMARQLAMTNNVETRILLVEYDTDVNDKSLPNKGLYRVQLGNHYKDSDTWDTLPFDVGPQDLNTSQGTFDISRSGNQHVANVSLQDWGTISGPSGGNENAIVFNSRGMLKNPYTDLDADGGITVTFTNKQTVDKPVPSQTTIRVYSTGMTRTFQGAPEEDAVGSMVDTGDTAALE